MGEGGHAGGQERERKRESERGREGREEHKPLSKS